MDEREHAVLSLFYEEGKREVTPSLLAYRMRMNAKDAAKLLDGMVKKDILNLHVDEEGHISYRLPPSERHRIGSQSPPRDRQGRRSSDHQSRSGPPLRERPDGRRRNRQGGPNRPDRGERHPPGTDATPGYSDSNQGAVPGDATRRHDGPEGTDGTVGPTSGPVTSTRSTEPEGRSEGRRTGATTAQDWYVDEGQSQGAGSGGGQWTRPDPQPTDQPPRSGPPGRRREHPDDRRDRPRSRQQQELDQRGLTPYQSEQVPATRQTSGGRNRIPVLAGALSLLIPGLGQFYNGEISKGVMLLFSYVFLLLFWLFWIVHIWSIIDAYMVAEQSNQSLPEDSDQGHRPMLPDQSGQTTNPNSTAA